MTAKLVEKTKLKPKQLLRSHKCHEFTTKFKKTVSTPPNTQNGNEILTFTSKL